MLDAELLAALQERRDPETIAVVQDYLDGHAPQLGELFRLDQAFKNVLHTPAAYDAWLALERRYVPDVWDPRLFEHYRVTLEPGERRIACIQEIRVLLRSTLRHAVELTERPSVLFDGLDAVAAYAVMQRFWHQANARVSLEPASGAPRPKIGMQCTVGDADPMPAIDACVVWLRHRLLGDPLVLEIAR